MTEVGDIEHKAESRLDTSHVVGSKLASLIACLAVVHVHLTNQVRQLASIDLHWTRSGAEAVGGTGGIAVILVLLFQRCQTFGVDSSVGQFADFALYGNTHTRGEGESARHAVDLAESALDALIGAFHGLNGLLGR